VAAKAGRDGILTEIQARKVVSEIYQRATGDEIKFDTIESYLTNWLTAKKGTTSPGTQRIYGDAINAFLSHLGNKRALSLAGVDKRHFISFREVLTTQGKANKTINLIFSVLRAALNDARREQKLTTNPAEALRALPANSGERQRFTTEQIAAILKTADDEWKGATLLGAHHAMRLGDAANLKRSNVDFIKKVISFSPQKQKRTAKQKQITIPMHPEVEKQLLKLPIKNRNPDAPLFPSLAGREVRGDLGLSNTFVALIEKAGIVRQVVNGEARSGGRRVFDLGFHSLRHTSISAQSDAGVPSDIRQKMAGHAGSRIHDGYNHPAIKAMREQIEKVPSFLPES